MFPVNENHVDQVLICILVQYMDEIHNLILIYKVECSQFTHLRDDGVKMLMNLSVIVFEIIVNTVGTSFLGVSQEPNSYSYQPSREKSIPVIM